MSDKQTGKDSPSRGGAFSKSANERMLAFTESISYDRALYAFDIQASKAHAAMLQHVGLISEAECEAIQTGLDEIQGEIEAGTFPFKIAYEDIHMNIEQRLGKLHTARSRNDQIATDERLWVRHQIDLLDGLLNECQGALVHLAERYADAVMPGYTHLQRAQPVSGGHFCLAYVEMLGRDRDRLQDARRRANVLPLGAGALAGTSLPIDREFTRIALGFDAITRNSMDSTADRDYLLDFCFGLSVGALHLSRLCEDLILYASTEFGFLQIDEAFCTGSSIMPQKRNPDVLELLRGKKFG